MLEMTMVDRMLCLEEVDGDPPPDEQDDEGGHGADAGRLGGGDDPAVDAAQDRQDDHRRGQKPTERGQPFLPGDRLVGRGRDLGRLEGPNHRDRHEEDRGEKPGDDAGHEEPADGGAGERPVEDHRDARGDQYPQGAARGQRSVGQAVVIAALFHLGAREDPHRRRRGDAGARDRREDAAGDDVHLRETAGETVDPFLHRVVELLAESPLHHELPHQDEQDDGGQGEAVEHGPYRGGELVEDRFPQHEGEAEDADRQKDHRHGHLGRDQEGDGQEHEEGNPAVVGFKHGRRPPLHCFLDRAGPGPP